MIEMICKDLDNIRCEYDILKQRITHWMPCDEPVKLIFLSNDCCLSLCEFRQLIVYL